MFCFAFNALSPTPKRHITFFREQIELLVMKKTQNNSRRTINLENFET